MSIYLNLFAFALIPVGLTFIIQLIRKKTPFGRLPIIVQQLIIGILFGAAAVCGTEFGVDVGGAVANARDAAPLCAGLFFGMPAGIIAGVIGGVERWYAIFWGAGMYSRVACSVSTLLAGFYAAFLRKYVFEKRRPSWLLSFVTGVVMEVIHMLILFLTHLADPIQALDIVKICAFPMILCNGVSVMLASMALGFMVRVGMIEPDIEKADALYASKNGKYLAKSMQARLLITISVAFVITGCFAYIIETEIAEIAARQTLTYSIEDAKMEMTQFISMSDNAEDLQNTINYMAREKHVGANGNIIITDKDWNSVGTGFSFDTTKELTAQIGAQYSDKIAEDYYIIDTTEASYMCFFDKFDVYRIISAIDIAEVYRSRDANVYINLFLEVVVFAIMYIVIYLFVRTKVLDEIREVTSSLHCIIDGNLDERVDVYSSAEFTALSDDINSAVDTLKQYAAEAEMRYKKEMELASSIQHSAVPNVFPAYPDIHNFDIFATMDTAKEVGGDFYDFYMLGQHKLAFMIADVSGKGVPAAMFMMTAKTTLRNLANTGRKLDKIFEEANNSLCEGNEADMFVTGWMGIIDLRSGHIEFVNAGHNPPLVYRKNVGFTYLRQKANLVLACMPDMEYQVQEFDIEPGDRIYLYTDGITEATSTSDELYGEERLLNYVNDNHSLAPEQLLGGIKENIDEFVGEREQFDDMTMLIFDYNSKMEA